MSCSIALEEVRVILPPSGRVAWRPVAREMGLSKGAIRWISRRRQNKRADFGDWTTLDLVRAERAGLLAYVNTAGELVRVTNLRFDLVPRSVSRAS